MHPLSVCNPASENRATITTWLDSPSIPRFEPQGNVLRNFLENNTLGTIPCILLNSNLRDLWTLTTSLDSPLKSSFCTVRVSFLSSCAWLLSTSSSTSTSRSFTCASRSSARSLRWRRRWWGEGAGNKSQEREQRVRARAKTKSEKQEQRAKAQTKNKTARAEKQEQRVRAESKGENENQRARAES